MNHRPANSKYAFFEGCSPKNLGPVAFSTDYSGLAPLT